LLKNKVLKVTFLKDNLLSKNITFFR